MYAADLVEAMGVLVQHPSIFEAAVVGEPHSDWGEQVVAFVLARQEAEVWRLKSDNEIS